VSQGDGASSKFFSACSAASRLIGVGLLPPSMKTRPERPRAPGVPPKFQVAYAEVIEPPRECPPTTTWRPTRCADFTTRRRSSISTRIPHLRA
jgi:hypothetical protein